MDRYTLFYKPVAGTEDRDAMVFYHQMEFWCEVLFTGAPPTLPRYSFGASQIIFFVDVCYTKKSRLTQNKLYVLISKICDTTGIKSFLYQWYIIFSFFSDLFRCDIINSQLCWCGKLEDTYYYFFTCKKYKEAINVLLNEIFNIVN